jgi:uncharacterized membrane protein YidH (DUF202 family)
MRWKRTAVALLVAGVTLSGCAGTNTDVTRGETNCDSGQNDSHDQNCSQTGTPSPAQDT